MSLLTLAAAPEVQPADAPLRVGFTGHRPNRLPFWMRPWLRGRIRRRLQALSRERYAGAELITGLAPGADEMAFQAARDLGWPIHVLLPRPAPDCDHNDLVDARLLTLAASVEITSGSQDYETSHTALAEHLLNRIDHLVAVYDGKGSAGPGGVADILARARTRGIPTFEIRT